ncbi:MAG TPA: hypothetical protein VFF69_03065 [Phycisphaerales bacterium]|nr:hypothetical protein [Phycisphaerales bacterium]
MRKLNQGMRRGGVLAGCLIAAAVVAILLVIGAVFVAMNWRSWTSQALHSAVQAAVSESALPAQEQQEVMAVADEFTAEFKAGEVSAAQFGQVLKQVSESPIMPAMVVMGVERSYIEKSSLSPEEKAEGAKHLSRFVRGVREGKISQTKIDDVTEPIHAPIGSSDKVAIHAGNINVELKQPEDVKPEELSRFLANAKAEADAAGIPDEKFEIDWSEELRGAIDRAMGRAEPAADEATETTEPADESGGG